MGQGRRSVKVWSFIFGVRMERLVFESHYSAMFDRISFWDRAAFLVGLMVLAALVDFYRHGRAAASYKEYGFIWLTGLIGCLVGAVTDRITSTISPEYFTVGKGLAGGDGFAQRVFLFSLQEGLSGGIIAGAICVYASRGKSKYPPLGFGALGRWLWMPIAGAAAGALLLPLAAGHSDPAGLVIRLINVLPPGKFGPFLRVWRIHTGLYAGLLAGLIGLLAAVWKKRRAQITAQSRL